MLAVGVGPVGWEDGVVTATIQARDVAVGHGATILFSGLDLVVAPGAEAVDKAFDGKLATVLETLGASGAEGEVTKLPAPSGLKVPVVIAVGLGPVPAKDDSYDAESLRRAAGSAGRALKGSKKAGFALPTESAEDAGAVAEGAIRRRRPRDPRLQSRQGRPAHR